MAYQYANTDTTEPISDTDGEIKGNINLYNVVVGCDVSLDATDLTYDVAAGVVTHNGSHVAVAAQTDAGTLVADGSNPRFTWIGIGSDGSDVMVSGDAAADPTVPEIGDRTALSLVKVPAGETLASNCTDIEKRIPVPNQLWRVTKSATETVNSTTTLQNDDELLFPVAASRTYYFKFSIRYNSGTTPDFKFNITAPSGATLDCGIIHLDTTGSVVATNFTEALGSVAIAGTGGDANQTIEGFATISTTAGNVTFQFAQNTSDAGNTSVLAGSMVEWRVVV